MCRKHPAYCLLGGRLDGKIAIVTGANSGIGFETTAELARRGCRVIMACRDLEQARYARQRILTYYGEGLLTVYTRNIADNVLKQYLSPVTPCQAG